MGIHIEQIVSNQGGADEKKLSGCKPGNLLLVIYYQQAGNKIQNPTKGLDEWKVLIDDETAVYPSVTYSEYGSGSDSLNFAAGISALWRIAKGDETDDPYWSDPDNTHGQILKLEISGFDPANPIAGVARASSYETVASFTTTAVTDVIAFVGGDDDDWDINETGSPIPTLAEDEHLTDNWLGLYGTNNADVPGTTADLGGGNTAWYGRWAGNRPPQKAYISRDVPAGTVSNSWTSTGTSATEQHCIIAINPGSGGSRKSPIISRWQDARATSNTASIDLTANHPGPTAGNLLLAFVSDYKGINGNSTSEVVTPAGWTELLQQSQSNPAYPLSFYSVLNVNDQTENHDRSSRCYIAWKISDGTESVVTFQQQNEGVDAGGIYSIQMLELDASMVDTSNPFRLVGRSNLNTGNDDLRTFYPATERFDGIAGVCDNWMVETPDDADCFGICQLLNRESQSSHIHELHTGLGPYWATHNHSSFQVQAGDDPASTIVECWEVPKTDSEIPIPVRTDLSNTTALRLYANYVWINKPNQTGRKTKFVDYVIPSTEPDADLTGFPNPVDLSDMPASFWANVTQQGENIRVWKKDGDEVPIEVVGFQTAGVNVDAGGGTLLEADTEISIAATDTLTVWVSDVGTNGFLLDGPTNTMQVQVLSSGEIQWSSATVAGIDINGIPATRGTTAFPTTGVNRLDITFEREAGLRTIGGRDSGFSRLACTTHLVELKGSDGTVKRRFVGSDFSSGSWPAEIGSETFSEPNATAVPARGQLHFKSDLSVLANNEFEIHLLGQEHEGYGHNKDDWFGQYRVWEDYAFVSHDGTEDATGNNTVTNNGATVTADGVEFDGASGDVVDIGSDASIDDIFLGGGTVSVRTRFDGATTNLGRMVDADASAGWSIWTENDNTVRFFQQFDGIDGQWSVPFSANAQTQSLTVTYDNLQPNDPTIYVDAVSQTLTEVGSPGGTAVSDASATKYIGNRADLARPYDGVLGEVRFSNSVLSADWISSEHKAFTSSSWATITDAQSGGPTNYSISLVAGTVNLSGGELTLDYTPNLQNYSIELDSGTVSLAGLDIDLAADRKIDLIAGDVSLTGGDLNLSQLRVFSMDLEAGTVTLVGEDIATGVSRFIELEAGELDITGQAIDLTYNQTLNNYELTLEAGTVSLTGEELGFILDRAIQLDAGTVEIQGESNKMLKNSIVALDAGSVQIAGSNIDLLRGLRISLEAGDISLLGVALTLQSQKLISLEAGDITIEGGVVQLTPAGNARVISTLGIRHA